MIQLVLGLGLWSAAHGLPRLAPGLHDRLGKAARPVVAVLVLAGLWLMIRGYGAASAAPRFAPAPWAYPLNYLMVLAAVYLYAASGVKTRAAQWLRHPQLLAVTLWAGAHLLVNAQWAALVLFGGLGLWAVAEMALLNARAPMPVAGPPVTPGRELRAVIGAVVVFIVIALVHGWVGPNPFGAL
ncbi:NnrU family protein [Limimaricola hongkongensis]|uniref:NnrU family protein in cluster with Mesaconyl-CoA hydratase n=1 Tax=Limimaricola hongkongensis DSM 17492 TaxID=1122180 RepID=A0A017H8N1_9RHOB|nr:NnrU family protein [Limimaricola hongkongensis]EYD70660.1 NnrU family protein in cluster with Mesaconyl-CoA hydratase [Limimaricola hongkongensis DSM 17492]